MRIFILLLFIVSCSPSRKLDKAEQLVRNNPRVAADICVDLFPLKIGKPDSSAYKQSLKEIDSLNIILHDQRATNAARVDSLTQVATIALQAKPECDTVAEKYLAVIGGLKGSMTELERNNKRLTEAARNVKPIRDTVVDTQLAAQQDARIADLIDTGLNQSRELDSKNEQIVGLKKSRNWWRLACIVTWVIVGGGVVLRIMGKLKPI